MHRPVLAFGSRSRAIEFVRHRPFSHASFSTPSGSSSSSAWHAAGILPSLYMCLPARSRAPATNLISLTRLTLKAFCPISTNTIHSLIKACAHLDHLKQVHAQLLTHGLHHYLPSLLSTTTLSYLSFGLLDFAFLLFRSIPNPSTYLWNILMRSCATHARFHHSLHLYSNLLSSGLRPGKFTFPFALKSCAALADLQLGRQLHHHVICFGCADDLFVGAALVDMYSKCGDVDDARLVFDKMSKRDLVSWTSMISGYAHNGCSTETLEFFRLMQQSDVKSNRVSLLSALLACGHLGALRRGECFHCYVIKTGLEPDILVATAVVDMYAKCGSLDLARLVFELADEKDVVCWSAMIASYGYHGLGKDAIAVFDQMVEARVKPNHATFTSLLSACSHSGLLEEGERYFHSMNDTFGVEPKLSHYACMVDILGRAGKLYEAQVLIEHMPMDPDSSLWGSLLGACQIYGDLDLAERIADRIFELNTNHSGYYVLLSNIYAAKSRWSDVERVRKLMVGRKVSKVQGFSMIELDNQVYKFGVGDRTHPLSSEIHSFLQEMLAEMKQLGYVPLMEFALHDAEDETKEAALPYHS